MAERMTLFGQKLVLDILDGIKTETRRPMTFMNSDGPSCVWRHHEDDCDEVLAISGAKNAWDELDFNPRRGKGDYCAVLVDGLASKHEGGEYLHVPARDHQTRHRIYCKTRVGDVLVVRETWRPLWVDADGTSATVRYCADSAERTFILDRPHVVSDLWKAKAGMDRDFPSIHMPRWACRIFLPVLGVKAERVQEIDDAGARAEGFDDTPESSARGNFAKCWHAIYGSKPGLRWDDNPWVWVQKFRLGEVRR